MPDQSPPPQQSFVQNGDLAKVIWIMASSFGLLIAFAVWLHLSGLATATDVSAEELRGTADRYYQDALDYRERRLTLGMVLRTFITGFSFAVGLALCTQGGIFILRQVKGHTSFAADLSAGKEGASPYSFSTYSPGVVFLLGGVTLMIATQYLSLPISSADIVRPGANYQLGAYDGAPTASASAALPMTSGAAGTGPQDLCSLQPDFPNCNWKE